MCANNDITIKFSHFEQKKKKKITRSRTATFISSSCRLPLLGSTFRGPDVDGLHQRVKQTLHVHMQTEKTPQVWTESSKHKKTKRKANLRHDRSATGGPTPTDRETFLNSVDKTRPDHVIKSTTLTTNTAGLRVGMRVKICQALVSKSLT